MAKIIDIDLEFEDVEFDETAIRRATGNYLGGLARKASWKNNTARRKQSSAKRKELNKELYGQYRWIVRSPGNDLLDFYDEFNDQLGSDNRAYSIIPPSVVYHYRFEHEYPPELFDKRFNYGRYAYLRDQLKNYYYTNDKTYWAQVYKDRYNWLVDHTHEEFVFDYRAQVNEFFKEKFDQQAFHIDLAVNEVTNQIKQQRLNHLFLRGKAKGWSIIVEPK